MLTVKVFVPQKGRSDFSAIRISHPTTTAKLFTMMIHKDADCEGTIHSIGERFLGDPNFASDGQAFHNDTQ